MRRISAWILPASFVIGFLGMATMIFIQQLEFDRLNERFARTVSLESVNTAFAALTDRIVVLEKATKSLTEPSGATAAVTKLNELATAYEKKFKAFDDEKKEILNTLVRARRDIEDLQRRVVMLEDSRLAAPVLPAAPPAVSSPGPAAGMSFADAAKQAAQAAQKK